MTAREKLLAHCEEAQLVIRAYMVKKALDDHNPDWASYATEALEWWDRLITELVAHGLFSDEKSLAVAMITALRKQPVWGKILRGQSQ